MYGVVIHEACGNQQLWRHTVQVVTAVDATGLSTRCLDSQAAVAPVQCQPAAYLYLPGSAAACL